MFCLFLSDSADKHRPSCYSLYSDTAVARVTSFKRGFKEAGQIKLSTFLKVYRVGDIVDIKANGTQQKGMPHNTTHGRVFSFDCNPKSSKDPGKLIFRDECSPNWYHFQRASLEQLVQSSIRSSATVTLKTCQLTDRARQTLRNVVMTSYDE
ncbi:hypothetical protein Pst134EA_017834 [Puccinia striiformis f. sp. tritici]|uniref:hypothetical protein n=1 Tax=Puccinia striiformis f. sp. tritici TaxID=168172 RepID=UPI002008306A|nr:hypothetical protein Pst134EA_017834 [Puccinia striiformis f. sp. tritici]KAH9461534.1 hypothetical protein Pst134EA_017834 [Puccinia striiformis f. sp. tritici]